MVNSKFVSSIVIGLLLATAGASAKSNHGIPTAHPVAHHVAQAGEIVGAAEAVGGAAATAYVANNHTQSVQDAGEAATGLGSNAVAKHTEGPFEPKINHAIAKHGRRLQMSNPGIPTAHQVTVQDWESVTRFCRSSTVLSLLKTSILRRARAFRSIRSRWSRTTLLWRVRLPVPPKRRCRYL